MLYTQGYLTDHSTTAHIDSRPIASGVVSPSATGPMWGGMAIQAFLQQSSSLGKALQLAQNVSQITGFTVFDKSTALIRSNTNPVPSAGPTMGINYVSLGSGAGLVVQADPSVLTVLRGASVGTSVSWDFQNQRVIPLSGAGALPVRVVRLIDYARVVVCDDGEPRWEDGAAAVVIVL
jgi:hypothetical protein